MTNDKTWQPSKYVRDRSGRLRASTDTRYVAVSSRLITELVAGFYDNLPVRLWEGDIADLGCGRAPLAILYSRHARSVVRVDWCNTLHGLDQVDVVADLRKTLPFKSESFDTVLISDVLEHIPNPADLVREIFRITKPGGHLVGNTPMLYWIHEAPFDYYRYTQYGLAHLLSSANFENVQIVPLGGAVDVLADIAAKLWARYSYSASALAQRGAAAFASTRLGRRIREASKCTFSLGYGFVAVKPEQQRDGLYGVSGTL